MLKYIRETCVREGAPPTIRAIRDRLRLSSTSIAAARVNSLVVKGWLVKTSRGLQLGSSGGAESHFEFYAAYDVTGKVGDRFRDNPWVGMALVDPRIVPTSPKRKTFFARICYREKTLLNIPIGSTLAVRHVSDMRSIRRPRWFLVRHEERDCIRLLKFRQVGDLRPQFWLDVSKDARSWKRFRVDASGNARRLQVYGIIDGVFVLGTSANIRAMRVHLSMRSASPAIGDKRLSPVRDPLSPPRKVTLGFGYYTPDSAR